MKKNDVIRAKIQKRILGQTRRSVQDYDMIQDGDRIAIGVSGGKDSITLLIALNSLRKYYPKRFEIEAITLTLGVGSPDLSCIENLCKNIGVHYTIENTLIGKIVLEILEEKNPCSLCANMRRAALHNAAIGLGCNKVALGHNKDDVIETFLLSMFYEGRINTFSPVTYLSRKNIFVIRPLIYSSARDINAFIKSFNIETVPKLCYLESITKREMIRNYLQDLGKDVPMIKDNIFGAIKKSKINGW